MTAPLHCWLAVKVNDDDLQLIPSGLTPRWLPPRSCQAPFQTKWQSGFTGCGAIYWSSVALGDTKTKERLPSFCLKNARED